MQFSIKALTILGLEEGISNIEIILTMNRVTKYSQIFSVEVEENHLI